MSISKLLIVGVVSGLTISNTPCFAESAELSSEMSVADFVARCPRNVDPDEDFCAALLMDIETGFILTRGLNRGYCSPEHASFADFNKIIEWLSQHRELYSQKVRVAATTAFKAVWPCK